MAKVEPAVVIQDGACAEPAAVSQLVTDDALDIRSMGLWGPCDATPPGQIAAFLRANLQAILDV